VWGNVTAKTGTVDSLFGYAGQAGYVYDNETGLYFLQSRYYDPGIGRFTTTGLRDLRIGLRVKINILIVKMTQSTKLILMVICPGGPMPGKLI
jgi:RHS repeat-associated protein